MDGLDKVDEERTDGCWCGFPRRSGVGDDDVCTEETVCRVNRREGERRPERCDLGENPILTVSRKYQPIVK